MSPLLSTVAGCAWAFEGEPFTSARAGAQAFPDDAELFQLFAPSNPEEAVWRSGWLLPGGIRRMLPFVLSDWLEIYAVTPPPFPRSWVSSTRPSGVVASLPGLVLYLQCVDAAFWRAWSPEKAIMTTLLSDKRARPAQWRT